MFGLKFGKPKLASWSKACLAAIQTYSMTCGQVSIHESTKTRLGPGGRCMTSVWVLTADHTASCCIVQSYLLHWLTENPNIYLLFLMKLKR
jgi:hypothetical protein